MPTEPNPQVSRQAPQQPAVKSARYLIIDIENEPAALARVVSLFSARGQNIESLNVTEVYHNSSISRIHLLSFMHDSVFNNIKHLIERLIPVHKIEAITNRHTRFIRELALFHISTKTELNDVEKLLENKNAKVIDHKKLQQNDSNSASEHWIIELIDEPEQIDAFQKKLKQYFKIEEISRTGMQVIHNLKYKLDTPNNGA